MKKQVAGSTSGCQNSKYVTILLKVRKVYQLSVVKFFNCSSRPGKPSVQVKFNVITNCVYAKGVLAHGELSLIGLLELTVVN